MGPDDLHPEPTEDWARTLLHRAADTIDVDPVGPLDEPPPRRVWPLLAAAAAVIAVATATAVVTLGDDPAPPPVIHPDIDQVPSVFGYDGVGAEAMLEAAGLVVTQLPIQACEPVGRAVETVPSAGSPIGPGDEVQVRVSAGDGGLDCLWDVADRTQAWAFLDFANGRGPAPEFDDSVALWVNGQETASLSAVEAAEPAAWSDDSALERLAADARATEVMDGETVTPELSAVRLDHAQQFSCGGSVLPSPLRNREALVISIAFPGRGPVGDCAFVFVFRTEGRVDTVALQTMDFYDDAESVPDVVGQLADEAGQGLEDAGLSVETHTTQLSACEEDHKVLAQDPEPGTYVAPGSTVTLDVNRNSGGQCGLGLPSVRSGLRRVAELFVAFAREDHPAGPPVDTPVDLYIGNEFLHTISAAASMRQDSWRGCPAAGFYAGRTCPFSFVTPIDDYPGPIAYTSQRPDHPCLPESPDLPEGLSAYHEVTVTPDEQLDCTSYWAVQLFVNDVSQIVAANIVWSEP